MLNEVFVNAHAAAVAHEKHEAKCSLLMFVHYFNCKYLFSNENLRLCSSAEAGIVLKF